MKLLNTTLLMLTLIIFASCGSDSNSDPVHIKMEFQDDAVDKFTQRSGIAYNSGSILNHITEAIIAKAHAAADGEISCMSGDQVTFDVDIFGDTSLSITTTCGRAIEADIRRQLLFAFAGRTLFTSKDGNRVLDLSGIISEEDFWGVAHDGVNAGARFRLDCMDTFTFVKNTGELVIAIDPSSPDEKSCLALEAEDDNNYCGTGNSVLDDCLEAAKNDNLGYPAQVEADSLICLGNHKDDFAEPCRDYYRQSLTFRFKNGLFEYGPNQAALDAGYGDSEYNWFCEANGAEDNCADPALDPRP